MHSTVQVDDGGPSGRRLARLPVINAGLTVRSREEALTEVSLPAIDVQHCSFFWRQHSNPNLMPFVTVKFAAGMVTENILIAHQATEGFSSVRQLLNIIDFEDVSSAGFCNTREKV